MKCQIVIAKTQPEIDTALQIRRQVFIDELNVPESIEVDEFDRSSIHFLAVLGERAVGTGRLRLKKCYAKFERIALLSECRGHGVGRKLMEYMQQYSSAHYPECLPAMHAQEGAIDFYKAVGWQSVGESFVEADIVHEVLILLPKDRQSLEKLAARHDSECRPDIKRLIEDAISKSEFL